MNKKTDKKPKRQSRAGVHEEGKTLLGAYIEPRMKALAMITQEETGMSYSQMIIDGIMNAATNAQVLVNGEIRKDLKDHFELCTAMVWERVKNSKKNKEEK